MPTTVYDETFDDKGRLIASIERVIDDPEPTDSERIADLESKLADMHATLDAVGKAASFEAAKTAIRSRIVDETIEKTKG